MSSAKRPSIGLMIIRCLVVIYDVLTFPIYFFIQKPWERVARNDRLRSRREVPDDHYSPYVRVVDRIQHYVTDCQTIPEVQRKSLLMNGRDAPALGYREILGEEEEKASNGKIFKKLILTDYQWINLGQLDERIGVIARGLLSNGVQPKDNVLIFAETRLEWFLSAQAICRIGASIATLYALLGDEGIVHGINETEVKHIITTQDLLPKLAKLKAKTPRVTTIIYIEGTKKLAQDDFAPEIKLLPFKQMVRDGEDAPETLTGQEPQPDDTAVILYTSGSTGTPKGVILTHKNFMSSVASLLSILNDTIISEADKHRYIAYLPLAHSLEFIAETFFFSVGVRIGYGTPFTLTDQGTALRRGDKGDLTLLKPTIMCAVPLILDRIRKTMEDTVERRGPFAKEMFSYALNYKAYWDRRGYQTPIVNKLVCSTIQKQVGGNLKIMVVGGAPLSPETQRIMKAALNIKLLQGFGSTETCAATAVTDFDDLTNGLIGAPLHGCKIKLRDWEEGGYRATDLPYPRGELIVSGDFIAKGYYKLDKQTAEEFETDSDGVRWFKMGDIGQVDERGIFKIIDRKKDLVKLSFGEYISLGKVEAELKNCRYVDNICVYGDSHRLHLVALVVPNGKAVLKLAQELDLNISDKYKAFADSRVVAEVAKEMSQFGLQSGLHRNEIPTKIKLVAEDWNPDNGLITAALKLKRKNIQNYYQKDIDIMYGKTGLNNNINNNHIINNNN